MPPALTAPEENTARFRVDHVTEIERILRAVTHERALVTLTLGDEKQFLVTNIVAIETGWVYIGRSNNENLNKRLLASEHLSCSTTHDHVKIEFKVGELTVDEHDGMGVLKFRLPSSLLYFQRREYYRLQTSLVHPVKCLINTAEGPFNAIFVDISIGGGMLSFKQNEVLVIGQVYEGTRITFPSGKSIVVNLKVLNTFDEKLPAGEISHRAGCQFLKLPASLEAEIQRFIIQVERERRHQS